MLIGVISDTHGYLNPRVFHLFAEVDHILHAGDVGDENILLELEQFAPLNAVSGNVDEPPTKRRPLRFTGTFQGVTISMTHGHHLDAGDYNASARKLFAADSPRIIIHGHSHIAKNDTMDDGVIILNPGAACRPRFRDVPSVSLIEIGPGPDQIVCRFEKL